MNNRQTDIKFIRKLFLINSFLFVVVINAFAQIQVIDGASGVYDPVSLIENVFLGDGVELTNISHNGTPNSVGFFSNALPQVGIERGIILSTGIAETAGDVNQGAGDNFGTPGTSGSAFNDPQLNAISNVDLQDENVYEISFIPISDTLRFRYVFASEEYPNYVCADFNDVFGFFIDGPNPAGGNYNWENIALIPDLADPSGLSFTNLAVSINTVNNGISSGGNPNCNLSYSQYFNATTVGETPEYNGYLDVFVAQAIVIPCEEYTIKLAIGDGTDDQLDSAVFLEAKSFGTGTLTVETETFSLDGSIAEGCSDATIEFQLPVATETDLPIDFNILPAGSPGVIGPVATNGVDYVLLSENLVIPAGSDIISFELIALEDNIVEGDEFFVFDIQRDICNRDTFVITIHDNELQAPILPMDTLICNGETTLIDISLPPSFMLPDPPNFQNTNDLAIDLVDVSFSSTINVSGVVPETLTQGMIKSICIDTLTHRVPYDLDIYLVSPGGQILELSTDNGWRPDPMMTGVNFMQEDTFLNTCFTFDAIDNINNSEPVRGEVFAGNETYTGNFQPEGVWSDLWAGDNPANGDYTLIIIDDEAAFNLGILSSWSICFQSVYGIEYEWSSDPPGSLSCTLCEDPEISPTMDTWYYLNTLDTYGCEILDSFFVDVIEPPGPVQNLNCDQSAIGELTFSWDAFIGTTQYEISLDGGTTWINVDLDLSYLLTGLGLSEDVSFMVRPVIGDCSGIIADIMCQSSDCNVPMVITESLIDASCFGNSDGSVNIEASGTMGPYNYQLGVEINNTGLFTDLPAGNYEIEVTDGLACMLTYQVTITQPDAMDAIPNVQSQISCFGGNDGSVAFEMIGGTGPFQFAWSSSELDSIAMNLEPGWNYVTVTDANLCTYQDSIILIQPDILSAQASEFESVGCFGESTGIAVVEGQGGTPPYQYDWQGLSNQDTLKNVPIGNYNVTITDDNGCMAFANTTITEPDVLSILMSSTDSSCTNSTDGTATADVSGGDGNYDYLWSNGGMTATISLIIPDKYYVTVVDGKGCTIIDSVEVGTPNPIDFNTIVFDAECHNANTGSIELTASGGIGNLNYAWLATETMQSFNTANIANLSAGEYCVTITDQNMCSVSLCEIVAQPDFIEITALIVPQSCNVDNGAIDITITGGTPNPNYFVTWENEVTFNGEDLQNLDADTYFVTVTDSNNCSTEDNFEVTENVGIDIQPTLTHVLCKGESTGSVELTLAGGAEPYNFLWSGPNAYSSNLQNIQNLEAGVYEVEVEDDENCVVSLAVQILEPDEALMITIENDQICFNETDGQLEVQIEGGVGAYQINWVTGESSAIITGLSPDTYTVTVTDENDCEVVQFAEVNNFGIIEVFASSTDASCANFADGTGVVDSILVNGSPAIVTDFEFDWNTLPSQSGQQANNLEGGQNYTVEVTSAEGCTASANVIINEPQEIDIALVQLVDPNCAGTNSGMIEVMATGGTGDLMYLWDASTGLQNGPIAVDLFAGNYSLSVTDDNGCSEFANYMLDQSTPIDVQFDVENVDCVGGNNGSITVDIDGGGGGYDILWSNNQSDTTIENLSEGIYYISITDINDCTIIDSVEVIAPSDQISIQAMTEDVSCFGGFDGLIEIIATGGNGIFTYSLDGENFNGSPVQIGLTAGLYDVWVRDVEGCQFVLLDVAINQPDQLEIEIGTNRVVDYGDSVQLFPNILNGVGDVSYQWTSSRIDQFSCDNCAFPTIENITESIFLTLEVVDENGCTDLVQITINARLQDFIDVPTGFTPNGDGSNDLLNVFGKNGITVNDFKIFDRWGELVYQLEDFLTNDVTIGWDGTFRGDLAQSGVYVWTAEIENVDGTILTYHGQTNLIR